MNRDLLRRVAILGIVLAPMAVLLPACNKHDNKNQPADTTAPSTTPPADTTAPAGGGTTTPGTTTP
jgi:hypothetical protein